MSDPSPEVLRHVLEHWKRVRDSAAKARALLDTHQPELEHQLPELVTACDKAISDLELNLS